MNLANLIVFYFSPLYNKSIVEEYITYSPVELLFSDRNWKLVTDEGLKGGVELKEMNICLCHGNSFSLDCLQLGQLLKIISFVSISDRLSYSPRTFLRYLFIYLLIYCIYCQIRFYSVNLSA